MATQAGGKPSSVVWVPHPSTVCRQCLKLQHYHLMGKKNKKSPFQLKPAPWPVLFTPFKILPNVFHGHQKKKNRILEFSIWGVVSFSCPFYPLFRSHSEILENESCPCVGVSTECFIFILLFPVVTTPFPGTFPSRRAAALQAVTRTDEARLHLTALSAERVRRGRSLNTTPVL